MIYIKNITKGKQILPLFLCKPLVLNKVYLFTSNLHYIYPREHFLCVSIEKIHYLRVTHIYANER